MWESCTNNRGDTGTHILRVKLSSILVWVFFSSPLSVVAVLMLICKDLFFIPEALESKNIHMANSPKRKISHHFWIDAWKQDVKVKLPTLQRVLPDCRMPFSHFITFFSQHLNLVFFLHKVQHLVFSNSLSNRLRKFPLCAALSHLDTLARFRHPSCSGGSG